MKQSMEDLIDHAHFIGAWFRNPLQTGALWPSGQVLACAMVRCVDPDRPGPVVELGAGTEAITQALLARGLAPQRLVAIEKDPVLCRMLVLRFPEATVLRGDVVELDALLATVGAGPRGHAGFRPAAHWHDAPKPSAGAGAGRRLPRPEWCLRAVHLLAVPAGLARGVRGVRMVGPARRLGAAQPAAGGGVGLHQIGRGVSDAQ